MEFGLNAKKDVQSRYVSVQFMGDGYEKHECMCSRQKRTEMKKDEAFMVNSEMV